MNWRTVRQITFAQVATFLALMLVVMAPQFTARLPSLVLGLMGGWLAWTQRASFFASVAVRRLMWIFALMWIPILISVPGSYDWRHSAEVAIVLPLFFLAGVALVHALHDDARRLWLAKWLTIVMLIWMADGFIQYVVGRDLLGYPLTVDGRVTGPFHGNMSLSTALAILLPIGVWSLMRLHSLAVIAMFVGAGVAAVLVGTRNALAMMTVVAVGTSLHLSRRHRIALVVAALIVGGAIGLSPAMQQRLDRTPEIRSLTFQNLDHILSGRLTIWETAGRMMADRPWTGVGAGMFATIYDRYSTRPDDPFRTGGAFGHVFHAHNVYVSIAAETGVIGLATIICAFVLCVRWYYAASPERRAQAWPYSFGLLIVMFPFSIEFGMYTLWLFPMQLLLLSAMLAALSGKAGGAKQVDAS